MVAAFTQYLNYCKVYRFYFRDFYLRNLEAVLMLERISVPTPVSSRVQLKFLRITVCLSVNLDSWRRQKSILFCVKCLCMSILRSTGANVLELMLAKFMAHI